MCVAQIYWYYIWISYTMILHARVASTVHYKVIVLCPKIVNEHSTTCEIPSEQSNIKLLLDKCLKDMNLGFAHAFLNHKNCNTKRFKFTSLGATSYPVCSYEEVPPPDAIFAKQYNSICINQSTNHSPV